MVVTLFKQISLKDYIVFLPAHLYRCVQFKHFNHSAKVSWQPLAKQSMSLLLRDAVNPDTGVLNWLLLDTTLLCPRKHYS